MKIKGVILSILAAGAMFSCSSSAESNKRVLDESFQVFSEEYYSFQVNEEYNVNNHVWGFYLGSYDEGFTQSVFYDSLDPSVFGWQWNLEGTSKYPSYPRVQYGGGPWDEASSTPDLHRQMGTLESVLVSADFDFNLEGVYNSSFDLWITETDTPKVEEIAGEVMIWINNTKIPDTEITIESLEINDKTYGFYKNTDWNDFPLLIFISEDQQWNGKLDIQPFIAYLIEKNHLSSETYLADVQFGNEIWSGAGTTIIKDYHIQVK